MIVDDETDLVEFLAKRLRKRGFDVETADSGEAALEQLPDAESELEQGKAILLVDDEEDLLDILSKRLRKRGFRVETIDNGKSALEMLDARNDIDVVVLDEKMVGMTGLETLKVIKERHPHVEVIMLTGHGSVRDAMTALKQGALDYLTKPLDIQDLVDRLDQARSTE